MPRSDAELMLDFQLTGNEDAFAELVRRYQKPLVNFFHRLTWDEQQAEDLTQEVYCRVFLHSGSYKAQAKFSTYLFRIARNLWIDHYRAQGKLPQITSLSARSGDGSGGELIDSIAARDETAECVPTGGPSEMVCKLQHALEQLSEEQRLVFVMAKSQSMKYSDIADALRIPVGTVRSRMHAAVQKLQHVFRTKQG